MGIKKQSCSKNPKTSGFALISVLLAIMAMVLVIGAVAIVSRMESRSVLEHNIENELVLKNTREIDNARQLFQLKSNTMVKLALEETLDKKSTWYLSENSRLMENLQVRMDSYFCPKNIRIYLTNSSCDTVLQGDTLEKITRVKGWANTGSLSSAQTYDLPFIMVREDQTEGRTTKKSSVGYLRIKIGNAPLASFNSFFGNANGVIDKTTKGDLYAQGIYNFSQNPHISNTDMILSSSCSSPSLESCAGSNDQAIAIKSQILGISELQPSSEAPCLDKLCLALGGGLDMEAPYISMKADTSTIIAGGLHISGDAKLYLEAKTDASLGAGQYLQVCNENCTEYFSTINPISGYSLYLRGDKGWKLVNKNWDATVYGSAQLTLSSIDNFTAAIADQPLSIFAERDLVIDSNLRYLNPPCNEITTLNKESNCNNLSAKGILGLASLGGDLRVGDNAPANLSLAGVLYLPQGQIQTRSSKSGSLNLLGSLISESSPQKSGSQYQYGVIINFDERLENGLSPIKFPRSQLEQPYFISSHFRT